MDIEPGTKSERKIWGGNCEYILSLFGYLSGAGDFWKFPYLFWKNGGGTFIMVYLVAIVICSIPTYFLEVTISQYSGKGMYDIWCICPLFKGVCITMFIVNVAILLVHPTLRYWIMAYIRYSFQTPLPWTTCGNSWNTDVCVDGKTFQLMTENNSDIHWNISEHTTVVVSNITAKERVSSEEEFWKYELLDESSGIEEFGSLNWQLVLCNFLLRAIVAICVLKSVKSVGKVMYVTTCVPFILLVIVWIRTLLLPGATEGLLFFLTPDFSKLADKQMWMQAGFAALNSLAVGMGGTLVIGSRGNFRSSVMRSTFCACSLDVFGSIFTSTVLFSVLGVMAAEQGKPVSSIVTSGTSIAFVGFTKAFSFLPSPKIWTIIYFTAVFLALLDVVVMSTEVVITFIMECIPFLRCRHTMVVIGVFLLSFTLSLPFVTKAGPYVFQLCQWYYGTWSTLITALIECIICMWIFGGDQVDRVLRRMVGRPMPVLLRFLAAFMCPLIYMIFLMISIVKFRPPTYGDYHFTLEAEIFGYCLGILPLLPIPVVMAVKVYRTDGPILQRFKSLLQPTSEWGPIEEGVNAAKVLNTTNKRSVFDVAYYNMYGEFKASKRGHLKPETSPHNETNEGLIILG